MAQQTERIYSAAIWYKDLPTSTIPLTDKKIGIVVRGHRHADIIHTVYNLLGKRTCTNGPDCTGESEQGFVTNKGSVCRQTRSYADSTGRWSGHI